MSTPRYITIYFSTVSGSDATVLICKSSNNEQVAEFSIPTVGPSSTISTIRYLPSSGSYYFFVIANGSYTSGGFSVDY